MKNPDSKADKKMFKGMLKKAIKSEKVTKHLKHDIKESKKGIKEDKSLMKSMKKGKY